MSRYRMIEYKERFNTENGNVELLTACPYRLGVNVASNECGKCEHFKSLYIKGYVECANPIQFEKEPKQLEMFEMSDKMCEKVCNV